MRRVSVVGMSGSGKSTLARAIAERLGVPCIELDAIYHLPDWEPMPTPAFVAHLAFVRLRSHTEAAAWLASI